MNNMIKNYWINFNIYGKIFVSFITSVIMLALISIILAASTKLGYSESFRIIFGSIYVLFLPGFVISYIFFPHTKEFESDKEHNEKGAIDWIERIALSFALSIAIVPLTVFYLNLIGLRINALNSALTILSIILISIGILHWKKSRYDR